jgi:hypothetical protein
VSMEEFVDAVDRAFTRETDRIRSPFHLELKDSNRNCRYIGSLEFVSDSLVTAARDSRSSSFTRASFDTGITFY